MHFTSELQTPITFLFVQENIKRVYSFFLVRTWPIFWYQNNLGLLKNFGFAFSAPPFSVTEPLHVAYKKYKIKRKITFLANTKHYHLVSWKHQNFHSCCAIVKILMFSTHSMKYIWYSPQKSKYPPFMLAATLIFILTSLLDFCLSYAANFACNYLNIYDYHFEGF